MAAALAALASSLMRVERPVYLIDVSCFKPPEEFRVNRMEVNQIWTDLKVYEPDMQDFQRRVAAKSGMSLDGTYLPPAIHPKFCGDKPRTDLAAAHEEAQMTVTGAVAELLAKTGLKPTDIDILVTTCSIYCPTPSMASMVVNHFKMREDVQSYHLGGMGCSNGAIGVNLVRDLLQARPNSNALFVTTETTTPAYYKGKDKHRQVTNLIFRMGAAAVLMSNKPSWGRRIKYKLLHRQRVHLGRKDDAFSAIHFSPDDVGINGVYLGKNVTSEAAQALTKAMTNLAPHIMTWGQLGEYASTWLRRRMGDKAVKPYVPRFADSVDFFLIHAGGAKVLDGIGAALHLDEAALAPSHAVMHDYGNVSSSSTWYTLAYIESVGEGLRRGDKVLQVGVGSGIKCGVNVWQAQRDVKQVHKVWEHRVDPTAEAGEAAGGRTRRRRAAGPPPLALLLLFLLALLALLYWSAGSLDGAMRALEELRAKVL